MWAFALLLRVMSAFSLSLRVMEDFGLPLRVELCACPQWVVELSRLHGEYLCRDG